ncbi:MAG: hypothetical protein HKM95_15760 [Inquilinus sp.]|nr:hypothetical protein [Inquilinus sp.]
MNAARPDFVLHVGDFKSGKSDCSDDRFALERDMLNSFDGAVIYTPGDNEWTDCHRSGYDPVERLARLRSMFFATDRRFGRQPIALERQSSVDAGTPTPENAFWWHNGIAFATVHVVGSNNNADDLAEFSARDAANTAWIGRAFARAAEARSAAVVLALHADIFVMLGRRDGFRTTLDAIEEGARSFGGPVLVIHGDSHRFVVDQAMVDFAPDVDNLTRLQVFGDSEVHAVRVLVDPAAPGVFAFQPLIVPGNTRSSRGG